MRHQRGVLGLSLAVIGFVLVMATTAGAQTGVRARVAGVFPDPRVLSQGARAWLERPRGGRSPLRGLALPSFGTNVDANDPAQDLAAGQSETAIAAQPSPAGNTLVMAGWNDASAFTLTDSTDRRASLTGVAVSGDGARSFTDLIGLPNPNPSQQWSGDPAIASLGDGRHFAVASLYFPSSRPCSPGDVEQATIAVSIAEVDSSGQTARFSDPIPVADAGNLCEFDFERLSLLDKDWVAYDPFTRTLAVSYTRFRAVGSGLGQIETVRARVPADPLGLRSSDFAAPIVVWPEEPFCPGIPSSEQTRCGAFNQGAYATVAPGGEVYVAWERNIDNLFSRSGDPFAYIHAAGVRAGANLPAVGGPDNPLVVSRDQPNGNADGGVKTLSNVAIAGYNRGTGNDFPRIAFDVTRGRVVFAWNDASLHPLGDIWLRSAPRRLRRLGPTEQVNDDDSFALHFLPAVSVRGDGTICTSWYDRRLGGADSTRTDYFADCRPAARLPAPDVQITTGSTDWAGTSSLITPNFGDYTDNASTADATFFTWSDGRIGVPQPFVDRSP